MPTYEIYHKVVEAAHYGRNTWTNVLEYATALVEIGQLPKDELTWLRVKAREEQRLRSK